MNRLIYVKAFTKAKGGNKLRELFEQKYKECEKSLFLVAVGYLHNSDDAKDCVQEAVLSAFKSFDKIKNKEFFKTWMTRIVINKCKDFLKKQRYTEELTDNLNVFYSISTQDMEIMESLCKMDSKKSLYITLRFYNDMTVKYKTKKALEELKSLLEGDA